MTNAQETACCIVGGGPAGTVLAYLLARRGIDVDLLEMHADFDRDFRGDTIHPSTMDILDELGLADRLLELPHTKMRTMDFAVDGRRVTIGDFRRLRTRFRYVVLMPQVRFLEFLAEEAARFPGFHLHMQAAVQELIEEGREVKGVRFRDADGVREVRAVLTVGADGRFSKVRHLAGLKPLSTSPPMDVLWLRITRRAEDGAGGMARFKDGRMAVALDRGEQWQVAYVIPKGSYQQLRSAGVEPFQQELAELLPEFADRTHELRDWHDVSLLSVESSRLRRWYRPGLLLIGDAAHVMSPVGGVGINYAIQDAVAAANSLSGPLEQGRVSLEALRSVQRRRELPVRIIQALQALLQKRVISEVLGSHREFRSPSFLTWPGIRDIPPRVVGYGLWPVHVRS